MSLFIYLKSWKVIIISEWEGVESTPIRLQIIYVLGRCSL